MSTSSPRVSVLLPVKNGMPWLPSAIASVLGQTLDDLELIVLEDGSTDSTARYLDTLRDERVRIIPTRGVGIARALNVGLAAARAAIVARQDADDESLPNRLMCQVATLDSLPDIDLVATTAEYIDSTGTSIDDDWVRAVRSQQDVAQTPHAIAELMPLTCCVTHGSITARAAVLRGAGGYRDELVPAEDYDLWLRLLPNHRFVKLADRLYRHRLHDGQSGRQARALQTHQAVLAKLLHVRRMFELPALPRLAITGNTRGDAFYRAAAAEAGFEIVSGSYWDVLAITDFAHVAQYRQAVNMSTAWPTEMIGNLVVRRSRGAPALRRRTA